MAIEVALTHDNRGKRAPRSRDDRIAELAERQYGLVARAQLVALGMTARAVEYRVEVGRLRPVHRGVYAVGHSLLSVHARRMAAVLAMGEGAVVSHRDAGAEWAIVRSNRGRVDVTVAANRRPRRGIDVHRSRLPADEVTLLDGIPITTVPRTLFDLAAVLPPRRVERALAESEVLRLTDPLSLPEILARHPGHRGAATLHAILADADRGRTVTKEELEELFGVFVAGIGVPRPETNRWLYIAGIWIEADCVWHAAKLIVELDGYAVHGTRRRFESDRSRDRKLAVEGWRVVRVTWRQLHDEPAALAADLRVLLGIA